MIYFLIFILAGEPVGITVPVQDLPSCLALSRELAKITVEKGDKVGWNECVASSPRATTEGRAGAVILVVAEVRRLRQ